MFTWKPIHREAAERLLTYANKQDELLELLREMEKAGLRVISLMDKNEKDETVPLAQIDPFTFLATFNRSLTDDNRRKNWLS